MVKLPAVSWRNLPRFITKPPEVPPRNLPRFMVKHLFRLLPPLIYPPLIRQILMKVFRKAGTTIRQQRIKSSAVRGLSAQDRRGAALKAIERALRDTDFETLMEAVRVFANSSAGRAGKFCPYPSTWFNRRQWEDDRQEWDRPATRKRAFDPTPYQKFIAEREGGK